MLTIAGSFAEYEKARLVAKLKAARDRKRAETGKCGGRKSYAEARPEVVALAKELSGQRMSYRKISAELASRGHTTATGRPYVADSDEGGQLFRLKADSVSDRLRTPFR
jgi:DNA invertase Pin-like site-specific DNA recombinase